MKIYKDQDVLSAARDRYKFIFNNFDNVCFCKLSKVYSLNSFLSNSSSTKYL